MNKQTSPADTANEATTPRTFIELDDRRRASLGKIGRHTQYLVHEEPDGTLVLEPAVVLSEMEARLHANPQLLAQLEHSIAHPELRRTRPKRPTAI